MSIQIKANLSKKSKIIFILMVIMFLQGCISSNDVQQKYLDTETRLTDEAISKSPALQELDKICSNINLPKEFVFISKGGIDDQKISLSYKYDADIAFDKAQQVFEKYFSEKGWIENNLSDRYPKQLDFTNDKYRIAIYYSNKISLSNYRIYCEKLN